MLERKGGGMKRRRLITQAGLVPLAAAFFRSQLLCAERLKWQADGVATHGRLGVLTPDLDPAPESGMWAMVPPGVSIHAARVPWKGDPRTFAEPPHVDQSTEELLGLTPRAILFAFTSSSYALGAEGALLATPPNPGC
jgi:hypothetical protein